MLLFFIVAIISAILQFYVSVNYSMADYLPEDTPSTVGKEVIEKEFDESVPNTRVMVYDVSIQEALSYKEKFASIEGVTNLTWLDDAIDITTPIEMADSDTVEDYYKDGTALFSLTIRDGEEVKATDAIYEIIGEENAMDGEALDNAVSQKMAGAESLNAALLLIPIIIIILILSTTSWAEPIFFLTAIGISVLINMGLNIFIGEISFVTQSVAPVLQLAVSLDYAIFLLHSFSDYRNKTEDPHEAMQLAMKRSFPAIAASASTTFFGFMALSLMNFEIGADLGINLVKGILLSFISVMVFLPAFTLLFYTWIDKTKHKALLPKPKGIAKPILKLKYPVVLLVFLVIVPAFLAQGQTNFIYGIGEHPESTRAGKDSAKIEEAFGEYAPMVLLVPKGDLAKEEILVQELENLDGVTSILSYVNRVSAAIPPEFLDESITENFFSENFSRLILHTNTGTEGDKAFSLVEKIKETAQQYYGEEIHLVGESASLYDIKHTVEKDNRRVNLLTVATIALVLLITFKSVSFPVVLLLTIQVAVWVNLSIPYFTDTSLVYVGYLIISTVQLAATVDYAILLTEDYRNNRKEMGAIQAIHKSMDEKIYSITVSALILSLVGFILSYTSSNPIVSSIGLLLGRGTLLSFAMVICFLPAMLVIFDKWINKMSWKRDVYTEDASN